MLSPFHAFEAGKEEDEKEEDEDEEWGDWTKSGILRG